jgi:hypothetical protein
VEVPEEWGVALKIDKRIVGLALVSVILSTLIMVTIARERIDQPVEILKNDHPDVLEQSRKATFSFAMVARKKCENLQIRFSILSLKALKFNEMIDPKREYNTSSKAEDVLENIVKLGWLRNETSLLGIGPEVFDLTVNLEGVPNRMLIHDYSSIIDSLSGREAILGAPLTYAAIIDENGEEYYLEGISDIFFNPLENVISLSTSHNAEEQNYLPDDQIWEGSNRVPLSEAPEGGILTYSDVEKDDTFTVIFTVEADRANLPEGFGSSPSPDRKQVGLAQMISIYLDGALYDEPIMNMIKAK